MSRAKVTAQEATPAPKAVRDGRCGAKPFCRRACDGYRHNRTVSGFETCKCGHTRNVHEVTE